jgi:hypothetical protein
MSKRTEKRIGEVSVNGSVKHPIPTKTKKLFIDLFDAYKEAKKLTDEELKYDRMKCLKDDFNKFPYEYTDYNTHRWSIGLMIEQTERLGGVIMETHFGLLPEKKDKKLLE